MKPTQFGKQHATLQKNVINPLQKGTAHRQVFGALGMTPSQATGATKMLRTVGWDIPSRKSPIKGQTKAIKSNGRKRVT
jgi:hypothetical protein